jgi:hypothetical protein
MKHYSPAALSRLVVAPLLEEEQLLTLARAELDGTRAAKLRLAAKLGIAETRLTKILTGQYPLPACAAEALGYRAVTRFERIS